MLPGSEDTNLDMIQFSFMSTVNGKLNLVRLLPVTLTNTTSFKVAKTFKDMMSLTYGFHLQMFSLCLGLVHRIGCFKDTSRRAIPILEGKSPFLRGNYQRRRHAIRKCALVAIRRGYSVLGVQHSGQCASGPLAHRTFGRYGRSNRCRNGKGGPWANDVYRISGKHFLQSAFSRHALAQAYSCQILLYSTLKIHENLLNLNLIDSYKRLWIKSFIVKRNEKQTKPVSYICTNYQAKLNLLHHKINSILSTGRCRQRTVQGNCCVFPFVYLRRKYRSCTSRGSSRPWCPVVPGYKKGQRWGYCRGKRCKYSTAISLDPQFLLVNS